MMTLLYNGLVHLSSTYSAADTMGRLEDVVLKRGLRIVARVDHSRDAVEAGLTMPAATLLIFGNPTSGTPVMIAAPTAAIDLPLKALVWEDSDGHVRLSYNSPQYLQERHGIADDLVKNIAGIGSICEEAVR
jgi:uncharacterized protein (DUF302 family)